MHSPNPRNAPQPTHPKLVTTFKPHNSTSNPSSITPSAHPTLPYFLPSHPSRTSSKQKARFRQKSNTASGRAAARKGGRAWAEKRPGLIIAAARSGAGPRPRRHQPPGDDAADLVRFACEPGRLSRLSGPRAPPRPGPFIFTAGRVAY